MTLSPNHDPPRPSISSGRSKKSGADFEAALLNPEKTVFLSVGPDLEGEGQVEVSPKIDTDAPVPVEKRSFEEDLRLIGRKSQFRDGRPRASGGSAGEGEVEVIKDTEDKGPDRGVRARTPEMDSQAVFGVIPPTPDGKGVSILSTPRRSTEQGAKNHRDRRISQGTVQSQEDSAFGSPSRMSTISASSSKKALSLGLDGTSMFSSCLSFPTDFLAELDETQKMGVPRQNPSKRRSMFRSAGTASSPDLATLRKAKDAKATGSPSPGIPQSAFPSRPAPPPPLPSSQPVGPVRPTGLPPGASSPYTRTISRGSNGPLEGMERTTTKSVTNVNSNGMATIAERSNRSRESSGEGTKVSLEIEQADRTELAQ